MTPPTGQRHDAARPYPEEQVLQEGAGAAARVTALVITHNSAGHIRACVESCLRQEIPVLVIDNASADETLAQIPSHPLVATIANAENLGFAAAVNQGVVAHARELTLLLNPDVTLLDPIAPMVEATLRKGAAAPGERPGQPAHTAAAALLINPDHSVQAGFSVRRFPTSVTLAFEMLGVNRIWPSNPVNRKYRYADLALEPDDQHPAFSDPIPVEQPAGACLLFDRATWAALGGWDERFYPVWFEDVDFCLRLSKLPGRILLYRNIRAVHSGGHSVGTMPAAGRLRAWYGSLLKYAGKHYSSQAVRGLSVVAALGLLVRLPMGILSKPGRESWRAYGHCFRNCARVFFTGRP